MWTWITSANYAARAPEGLGLHASADCSQGWLGGRIGVSFCLSER